MDGAFVVLWESAYLQGQELLLSSGYLYGNNPIYLIVRRFCAIVTQDFSLKSQSNAQFGRFVSQIKVFPTNNTGISGLRCLFITQIKLRNY